jgi:hypothetical protein
MNLIKFRLHLRDATIKNTSCAVAGAEGFWDNNLNHINFLKNFYEYLTEKLKYGDVTCIILKLLT